MQPNVICSLQAEKECSATCQRLESRGSMPGRSDSTHFTGTHLTDQGPVRQQLGPLLKMQHAATRSLPLAAHPFRPAALSASPRHVTIGRAALTGGPGRTTSNPRRKAVLPRAKKPKEQPGELSCQ